MSRQVDNFLLPKFVKSAILNEIRLVAHSKLSAKEKTRMPQHGFDERARRLKVRKALTEERRAAIATKQLKAYFESPAAAGPLSAEEQAEQRRARIEERIALLVAGHPRARIVSRHAASPCQVPLAQPGRPPVELLQAHIQKLHALEADYGITPELAARAMNINPRTVMRWLKDNAVPQGQTFRRLDDLIRLTDHVRQAVPTTQTARIWLRSSNPYLGGLTPLDVLSVGKPGQVDAALTAWEAGLFA